MKFTTPSSMPARSDFFVFIMDHVFPDMEQRGWSKTGYGYTSACGAAVKETGLENDSESGYDPFGEDSDFFRLLFEMSQNGEAVFGKKTSLLQDDSYRNYGNTLYTFCDPTSSSWKQWLKQTGSNNRVNKSFDVALFFTYLLLKREEAKPNREEFFMDCLKCIGITDLEETVVFKLFDFDWAELGNRGMIGGKGFTRLANKAIILLGTTVLTIFELIGSYVPEKDQVKLQKVYKLFETAFREDIEAAESAQYAERQLFNSNKYFEPRSITMTKKLYPQDFFVLPEFVLGDQKGVKPFSSIRNASKSKRLIIMAKTGLGKSAFLQMSSLCMLYERFGSKETDYTSMKEIAQKLDVPNDMFVISVPARMFSSCFNDDRYKEWTTDFVSLFFNCMWKLSDGSSFYSQHNTQRFVGETANRRGENYKVTEALSDYIKELACAGKLLLILDSFDEISSGEMRKAYIRALAKFNDIYCRYPETNEVGAHVIVSSREMSPDTMKLLCEALLLEPNAERYGICQLNEEQRTQLIRRWTNFLDPMDDKAEEILDQIRDNHFYLDYSVNPYMLSVVCFYFGHDLGSITQRYISFLVDRMSRNNRYNALVIQDVLQNIVRILQDVAGETVTTGNPHFSRIKLEKYLSRFIDKTDLSENDLEKYIETLHEIFVTEVGLIVPADGADNDYQFINNQIRFELAAAGIERVLTRTEKEDAYREVILPSIANIEEYVGLLIPLLCRINVENVRLAEALVSDLAMYDFKTGEEERILIRAMLDLVLNRYGSNIATYSEPGDVDRRYVRRAQRLLLMRLFSSGKLSLSQREKAELCHSPALKENVNWFEKDISAVLG